MEMVFIKGEAELGGGQAPETIEARRDKLWRQRLDDLAVVRRVAVETPLVEISREVGRGNILLLKREDKQPNGSFKCRGPAFAMGSNKERFANGVTANSRGNHSGGVALVGRELGIPVDVFVPADTPADKIEITTSLGGADFRLNNSFDSLDDAAEAARVVASHEGKIYLPPYDDEDIVRGNATLATEMLVQLGARDQIVDGVHVAVGGGGLLSALADVNYEYGGLYGLYGAEPEGANSGTRSFEAGRLVELSTVDTTAEGLAVRSLGKCAQKRMDEGKVDGMRTVSLASIGEAYQWYFDFVLPELGVDMNDQEEVWQNTPEVSAMVAVAAALEHMRKDNVINETHLAIVSGGNADRSKVRLALDEYQFSRVSLDRESSVAGPPTRRAYVSAVLRG